jgi:hypothetical protein
VHGVNVETALVVATPEVEDLIGACRMMHDPAAQGGFPAHITLIYPFIPFDRAEREQDTIGDIVAGFASFSFRFARTRRFPQGTLWLEPDPDDVFVALTQALWDRWPDAPPYGGQFDEVIPHCTVAEPFGDPDLDAIESTVRAGLPVTLRASVVDLMIGEDGHWGTVHTFPLGRTA